MAFIKDDVEKPRNKAGNFPKLLALAAFLQDYFGIHDDNLVLPALDLLIQGQDEPC